MNEFSLNTNCENRDTVPVKVNRIFDSCSDKDCLANLPVTINGGTLPEGINIVRSRCASVEHVCVNVEPIQFNRGFYSIDLTFTFSLEILGYEKACSAPVTLTGTAYATKNCILYGSESSVRTFTSNDPQTDEPEENFITAVNLPTASISVLEPIVLETKIDRIPCCDCSKTDTKQNGQREIFVTLGLFSVIELIRPVTILVPALDYTIPAKKCCAESDSPCEVFDKLRFPEEEFSPVSISDAVGSEVKDTPEISGS